MEAQEAFRVKYVITGREERGAWIIQAFDRNDKPLSIRIEVSGVVEAWRIFFLLEGFPTTEPVEIEARREFYARTDEVTEIVKEKAS